MSTRTWTPLYAALCSSSKDAELPDDTCRAFYTRLLTILDSYGCAALKPNVIHAKVWPLLGKPVSETVRCLEACERVGLLEFHSDGEREWMWSPDWEEKAGKHLATSKRRGAPEWPESNQANRISGGIRRHPEEPGGSAQTDRQSEERQTEPRVKKGASARRSAPVDVGEILGEFSDLNTPDVRAAVDAYLEGRRERRQKPQTARGLRLGLSKLAPYGALVAATAIRDAEEGGWLGFHPPSHGNNGTKEESVDDMLAKAWRNVDERQNAG